MASTKQRADRQKQKEKKEKILLVVLVGVLIVVGAIMLPSMMKKPVTDAAPPATTSLTGAIPSGTPVFERQRLVGRRLVGRRCNVSRSARLPKARRGAAERPRELRQQQPLRRYAR